MTVKQLFVLENMTDEQYPAIGFNDELHGVWKQYVQIATTSSQYKKN